MIGAPRYFRDAPIFRAASAIDFTLCGRYNINSINYLLQRENKMDLYNKQTDLLLKIMLENSRLPYQEELAEFSHGELAILVYLRNDCSGVTSGELADALAMTLPRMSAAISGLIKKGLVYKLTDEADRRKTRIYITPAGITHVGEKEAKLRDQTANLITELGENDAREFIRISKLIHSLCKL